jgi:hypothetical protein
LSLVLTIDDLLVRLELLFPGGRIDRLELRGQRFAGAVNQHTEIVGTTRAPRHLTAVAQNQDLQEQPSKPDPRREPVPCKTGDLKGKLESLAPAAQLPDLDLPAGQGGSIVGILEGAVQSVSEARHQALGANSEDIRILAKNSITKLLMPNRFHLDDPW